MTNKIILYVAALVVLVVGGIFLLPRLKPSTIPEGTLNDSKDAVANPLQVIDLKEGSGKTAKAGDTLTVNYTGTLENGSQFDSSIGRAPFSFTLGAGQVIEGWDKGLVGMKESGKRKLIIPSDLGYGSLGSPPVIPPNATLIFEVELLKIGK